jgi:hypothetical protein
VLQIFPALIELFVKSEPRAWQKNITHLPDTDTDTNLDIDMDIDMDTDTNTETDIVKDIAAGNFQ